MKSTLTAAICSGWLLVASCGGEPPPEGRPTVPASAKPGRTGNQPPRLVDVTLEPRSPRPGERIRARAEVRDPEGDPTTVTYHWRIAGREVPSHEASIVVERVRRGDAIQVSAVARDANGESAAVYAYANVDNLPPRMLRVEMQPPEALRSDADLTALPQASDPDGDPLEYVYRWRVNGRDVQATSSTLTADQFVRGDRVEVEVTASDGYDASAPLRGPAIDVLNAPPRITSSPGAIGSDGVLRHVLEAQDPDGDRVLRYRLIEGPEGMGVGFSTGILTWAPGPQQGGRHGVEVAVEDESGARGTQRFSIDVAAGAGSETQADAPQPTPPDGAADVDVRTTAGGAAEDAPPPAALGDATEPPGADAGGAAAAPALVER